MNERHFNYTTEYISGVMSLRKPQKKSLVILEKIINELNISNGINLNDALKKVNALYPTCTDFERDFLSLSFVLATGVGKTRLIGAFITYLYTNHGIKNFFIVAPGKTVYDKLIQDVGDPSNPKYVFKGVGCFNTPPKIITNDEYRNLNLSLFESDINIYIYNIDKFNRDNAKMKAANENLGDSFFNKLSELNDLVVIMDEAHHYHGARGSLSLDELKPLLGLELTATPYYNDGGSKQNKFKNAVYEYPLSESIKDGYTRTPYAVTQKDIHFFNFGDKELDKIMIQDGVTCHERIKSYLKMYAENSGKHYVKPFMMIVCKDTDHANETYKYIISNNFNRGKYKNKTLLIHSNQSKAKRQENINLLLGVESPENPIEIVIHVDMLKEGWDINNLYTIVPLRTATSKILREQMVGRGLRLPYGVRVNEKDVDSVILTAHDKFDDILKEAQKGDSIFNKGNILDIKDIAQIENETKTQTAIIFSDDEINKSMEDTGLDVTDHSHIDFIENTMNLINEKVSSSLTKPNVKIDKDFVDRNITNVKDDILSDEDLANVYDNNKKLPLEKWIKEQTESTIKKTFDKFIPIPQIQITDSGITNYKFIDFNIETTDFNHTPIENKLLIQNLTDQSEGFVRSGHSIDFDSINPHKVILKNIREKPEIDYESCSDLLNKLISQVLNYYENKYGENGMKNIVMMNKHDITNKIYYQMLNENHFYQSEGFIEEKIVGVERKNYGIDYNYSENVSLFENYKNPIRQVLFTGVKKGVFDRVKFDSEPELSFAKIIERDEDVVNWLRPNKTQFNLYYNNGKRYIPDFVVEGKEINYLVEIKGEDRIDEPDVLAKAERAKRYCKIATEWAKANGYKEWVYIFIPSKEINSNSSFRNLVKRFESN